MTRRAEGKGRNGDGHDDNDDDDEDERKSVFHTPTGSADLFVCFFK